MTRSLVVALLLVGCGASGPWSTTAGLGWRWPEEPTVGPSTPALAQPVAHALERWGYGRGVPSCAGADICVIDGQRSHAGPIGDRCVAEVETHAWYVVAHELGHCLGLPHSDDPSSVMAPYSRPGQDVTDADRADLRNGDDR